MDIDMLRLPSLFFILSVLSILGLIVQVTTKLPLKTLKTFNTPHQAKFVRNVMISHVWAIINVLQGSLPFNPLITKKRILAYLVHLFNWLLNDNEHYIIVLPPRNRM